MDRYILVCVLKEIFYTIDKKSGYWIGGKTISRIFLLFLSLNNVSEARKMRQQQIRIRFKESLKYFIQLV